MGKILVIAWDFVGPKVYYVYKNFLKFRYYLGKL